MYYYSVKFVSYIKYISCYRPEFQAAAEAERIHKYTGQPEQYIPLQTKIRRYTCSVASVILMVNSKTLQ